jgi:hypothetical protein
MPSQGCQANSTESSAIPPPKFFYKKIALSPHRPAARRPVASIFLRTHALHPGSKHWAGAKEPPPKARASPQVPHMCTANTHTHSRVAPPALRMAGVRPVGAAAPRCRNTRPTPRRQQRRGELRRPEAPARIEPPASTCRPCAAPPPPPPRGALSKQRPEERAAVGEGADARPAANALRRIRLERRHRPRRRIGRILRQPVSLALLRLVLAPAPHNQFSNKERRITTCSRTRPTQCANTRHDHTQLLLNKKSKGSASHSSAWCTT